MNILLMLDHQRHPQSIAAFRFLCRRLRWQEPLTPLFVLGVDKSTTLSFTQEFIELFYNAEEFIALGDSKYLLAQDIQSITYMHHGYIWQRLPNTCWRLIHHPHPERLLSIAA